jgi:PAS domain S-box-containing protein
MTDSVTIPIGYSLVAIGVISTIIAVYVQLHYEETRARLGSLFIVTSAVWLIADGSEILTSDINMKLFFSRIEFSMGTVVPVEWITLTIMITFGLKWLTRKKIIMLSLLPALTNIIIFTNGYQGLFLAGVSLNTSNPFLPLIWEAGIWDVLSVAYAYSLGVVGIAFCIYRTTIVRKIYRWQNLEFITAVAFPSVINILNYFERSWFIYFSPTSLAATIASVILTWRMLPMRASDVVPVAQETLFENMLDPLIVLDYQDRIVDLNPSAQSLIGSSLSKVIAQPIDKIWSEWPAVQKELSSGKAGLKEVTLGKDEPRFFEFQNIQLTTWNRYDFTLLIFHDISELKRAEAEKLSAMQDVTGSIAHDIRNPLQAIRLAAHAVSNDMGDKKEIAKLIQFNVVVADNIIRSLMDFSSLPPLKTTRMDVNHLIQEALRQLLFPEKITVCTHYGSIPEVEVDGDQFSRVLTNIFLNATQAMPEGGNLCVSTRKTDDFIEIEVKDTGMGMSQEVLKKLFTPFFTTKAKGIGLGLTNSKRIVEAHKGSIKIESEENKGTTVMIQLPAKT